MKKSLKLLGLKSSGLETLRNDLAIYKNDTEVVEEANQISDFLLKENYLRKILEEKSFKYIKSKQLLINLIKVKDPEYACNLASSICRENLLDPYSYLLFAEVAIEHKAWIVAKSLLEVFVWLCRCKDANAEEKDSKLYDFVLKKIATNEHDHSIDTFWHNKEIDKFWVFNKLYYQSHPNTIIKYSFKLLDAFPGDIKNYSIVYKALCLVNAKTAFYDYLAYVERYLKSDHINKNLYKGLAYHSLFEFDSSIKHLQNVLNTENEKNNSAALFYLDLNYLLIGNIKEFTSLHERIIPTSDPAFTALFFIYSAIIGFKFEDAGFPNQKNVSYEIMQLVNKLCQAKKEEMVDFLIEQFKKLEFYKTLPYLFLYLAEMYIKRDCLEKAKNLLAFSADGEAHRLYSWIYRIEGKDDIAEKELAQFRKHWIPNKDTGIVCQLVDLNLPPKIPGKEEEIISLVTDAYVQTKELIQSFDLEYGTCGTICIEASCQDCCTLTFPIISYTEYLYLIKWLEKQPKELWDEIKQKSLAVVKKYKAKYGKESPFLLDTKDDFQKSYPSEFIFNCPNLGNNKCNVYEARPFTCRSYGFTSQDGKRFKGCSYFFDQFKGATKLSDVRKVINMASFFDFASSADKFFLGRVVLAPIPVWFAQSYEETLEKIKGLISAGN